MLNKKEKEKIKKMYTNGSKSREIASIFGISRQRAEQIKEGREVINKDLRTKIIKKYNYECQIQKKCNGVNYKRKLEIHHIDIDSSNNNEENLIPVCKECHTFFHKIIKEFEKCSICFKTIYQLIKKNYSFNGKFYGNICKECWKKQKILNKSNFSRKFEYCKECKSLKNKHHINGICVVCWKENHKKGKYWFGKIRSNKDKQKMKDGHKKRRKRYL